MAQYAFMPLQDYVDICDAIREASGTEADIVSGDIPQYIEDVASGSGGSGGEDQTKDALNTAFRIISDFLEQTGVRSGFWSDAQWQEYLNRWETIFQMFGLLFM